MELGQLDQAGTGTSSPTGIPFTNLSNDRRDNTAVNRGNLVFSYAFTPTVQYSNLDPSTPSLNVLAPGSVVVGNIIPPANAGAVDPTTLVFKIFKLADFPSGRRRSP